MGTKPCSDSWDPQTRVSFPLPDRRAQAEVKFEHDRVLFAVASHYDLFQGEPTCSAYFVQESIFGTWCRLSKADYEAIVARCQADPSSKLFVGEVRRGHLNAVFRPGEFSVDEGRDTASLFEPTADETDVTVMSAPVLAHKEAELLEHVRGASA